MIKIEVNTEQNKIHVKSEVKGESLEVTKEIYTMLRCFEENFPNELTRAVTLLCIKYSEEKDG